MKDNKQRPVGRAGLKLEAALDLFTLGASLRGLSAVDIGSGAGGFTQVLLDHGAGAVLCVDVGRDQLQELLRNDPRVSILEKTDWKLLTLSEAPGPFDFFTVDVSFVAARNMMRGLAFRLRAGAQGVVLVKPQFELPDHLVRGGDVTDPDLRRQALETFTRKAEGLGFCVVAHADSPVAGREGTVEILTHVRFDGRPDKLPQPGERRSLPKPKARRHVGITGLSSSLGWFAVVAPGLEEVAAREAGSVLGADSIRAVRGGFELRGPAELGMRANLLLRIPTRLVLRMGGLRAREFGKLRHQIARLPWEAFLATGAQLRITASATHCRLYHTGAIDETVRAAIGDRLGSEPEKPETPSGDAALVLIRGVDDGWTVSIDSSGERLHRRGWRTESGEAPLRESGAAALLELAGWEPTEALIDPMCGVGTIPIEACAVALGIAPGLGRVFAFERWPGWNQADRALWSDIRGECQSARRDTLPAPIIASDQDAIAVAAARRNAARAGISEHLDIGERSLADVEAPAASGLFIANPPYGQRLGNRRELPALYREIGRVLRSRFANWRAAIVVPDARLASAFRVPLAKSNAFVHGGFRVTLLQFGPSLPRRTRAADERDG